MSVAANDAVNASVARMHRGSGIFQEPRGFRSFQQISASRSAVTAASVPPRVDSTRVVDINGEASLKPIGIFFFFCLLLVVLDTTKAPTECRFVSERLHEASTAAVNASAY